MLTLIFIILIIATVKLTKKWDLEEFANDKIKELRAGKTYKSTYKFLLFFGH